MSELRVTLEGYPENVQRIADAIDDAFPNMVIWVQSEQAGSQVSIKIEGYEFPSMPRQATQGIAA